MELTSCFYAAAQCTARGNCKNRQGTRNPLLICDLSCGYCVLLKEQRLSQLIAANEGLNGPAASKQSLDLAVLVHLVRRANWFCRQDLQCVGVCNAIPLECLWFLAVEHCQHDPAWPQHFRQMRHHLLRHHGFQIVQNIPQQQCIKRRCSVLQVFGQEFLCQRLWRAFLKILFLQQFHAALRLLPLELRPSSQNVIGSYAESPFDKETQCGLPCRAQVQQRAAAQSFQVP